MQFSFVYKFSCHEFLLSWLLAQSSFNVGNAMAQQAQEQFGYRNIQLIKTDCLGRGAYGAVYKVMCDDLPCAGKILHPTLLQSNESGTTTIMRQFQQECNFLSAIRHPNIVQYLGSYQDPETQLPVLLMELMDESLTRFLERSQEPLLYHTQINICHDLVLALAYLHSNDIIHRDLSSNNVFLIGAGNRAKVTDFGMAKLFNMNRSTMTPLTMCPGTQPYMSPEALDDPPVYTNKLDTFSFGVLGIQIITRQFPDPGPRTKKVQDPRDPKRRLQEVVPETERRKSHIDLIDPTHPLLLIAIDCLSYNEEDRPSAQELCHRLAALKQAPQYGDSVQQAQERSRPTESTDSEDGEGGERQTKPQKEKLQQQQDPQLQVSDGRIQAVIAARQEETQEKMRPGRNKEHAPGDAELQTNLQQREKRIQGLEEENQRLQHELQKNDKALQQKQSLKWKTCKSAPCTMVRGSATVCGNMAYFRPGGSNQVHSYNSHTEEWGTLPISPTYYFTLTVVDGFVTAVGGSLFPLYVSTIEIFTNTLLSLMQEGQRWKWVEHFPRMPTKRKLTAVVCSGKTLVVAGGEQWGPLWATSLATVEVMDTDTLQWSTASGLPQPLDSATATVCGDRVYLLGGWGKQSVFTCSLSALHDAWHTITDLPVTDATCVTLNGQLLAVSGYSGYKYTNNIYSYDTETNSWEVISHMPHPRYRSLVTVLPGNKLMVVGGMYQGMINLPYATDTVEITTLQ